MKKNVFKSRRFKHGSLATIITIGFIVAIVLINVVATMLLNRFPLTIDLTKDNRFQLTQESIDYVKKIDSEVEIIVCADESALESSADTKQAYEIIKNYSRHSGKISIDFVNLTKEPNFAKKYPDIKFNTGDILVKAGDRTNKISINDLFDQRQTQQGGQILSSKAEQVMTSSLIKVTDENPTNVSILTGIDNVDVSGYRNLLSSNTYQVNEQNLLTEEIDKEADIVILPQPAVDLTADNVKKLEKYLDNDGQFNKSLIFIASPNVEIGPLLKTFLAEWGMEVGIETIGETDGNNAIENQFNFVNEVADEEFAKQLKSQQRPIITSIARPINLLFEASENRKTKVLTRSFDSAILYPVGFQDDEDFNPSKQEKKSYNTMVIGSRNKYEGTTLHQSNVVVASSATMFFDFFLTSPQFANSDAVMTMTNNLTGKEDTVKILPVQLSEESIAVTRGQVVGNMIVFIVVIPLLILITGFVVWIRRRHL